jgi:hypothetical protein
VPQQLFHECPAIPSEERMLEGSFGDAIFARLDVGHISNLTLVNKIGAMIGTFGIPVSAMRSTSRHRSYGLHFQVENHEHANHEDLATNLQYSLNLGQLSIPLPVVTAREFDVTIHSSYGHIKNAIAHLLIGIKDASLRRVVTYRLKPTISVCTVIISAEATELRPFSSKEAKVIAAAENVMASYTFKMERGMLQSVRSIAYFRKENEPGKKRIE